MSAMILNIASNVLGLGNAATPFGIRAMQELDRLNPVKGTATNAMVLFLAINTAGLAILPTTVIALRASAGSKDPAGILVATWFASSCATIVAILGATPARQAPALPRGRSPGVGGRLRRVRSPRRRFRTSRSDTRRDSAAGSRRPTPPPSSSRCSSTSCGAPGRRPWGDAARGVLSFWMVPLLIAGLVLLRLVARRARLRVRRRGREGGIPGRPAHHPVPRRDPRGGRHVPRFGLPRSVRRRRVAR